MEEDKELGKGKEEKVSRRGRGPARSCGIWKYFSTIMIEDQQRSKCLVPGCHYLIKGRHTTTLKRHLAHHSVEYQEYLNELNQQVQCPTNILSKSASNDATADRLAHHSVEYQDYWNALNLQVQCPTDSFGKSASSASTADKLAHHSAEYQEYMNDLNQQVQGPTDIFGKSASSDGTADKLAHHSAEYQEYFNELNQQVQGPTNVFVKSASSAATADKMAHHPGEYQEYMNEHSQQVQGPSDIFVKSASSSAIADRLAHRSVEYQEYMNDLNQQVRGPTDIFVKSASSPGPVRSSGIWKYFSTIMKDGLQHSKCLVSGCHYSIKGRHTTTLKRHLDHHHSVEYQDYLNELSQQVQSPIDILVKSASSAATADKLELFEKSLLDFFSFTPTPFSTVEDSHFQNLIKSAAGFNPKINLPSRFILRERFSNRIAVLVQNLREIVKEKNITLCADIWSQKNSTNSYLGITCQFFDFEKSTVLNLALDLVKLSGSHTAEKINECLEKSLAFLSIREENIMRISRCKVQGANMIAAFKDAASTESEEDSLEEFEYNADKSEDIEKALNIKRIYCFTHILNSSLKSVFDKPNTSFDGFKKSILNFSSKVDRSAKNIEFSKDISNKKLLRYSTTRWNYFFLLLERLKQLEPDLMLLSCEIDLPINFTWQDVEKYLDILKPFRLERDITQNNSESISSVIPTMIEIDEHLSNAISKYPEEEALLNDLKARLSRKFQFALDKEHPMFDEIFLISTMLDPAKSMEITDELFNLGKSLILNYFSKFKSQEINDNRIIDNKEPPAKVRRTLTPKKESNEDNVTKELNEYLSIIESENGEILKGIDFWLRNSQRFPIMFKPSVELLSVPSTSSSHERLFNIAGYLSSGRRSNTSPMLLRERVLSLYNEFIGK